MSALVLVVEDDPRSRRLLHDLLEYEGYRVALAGDGGEAVRLAKQLAPSLVLMDIQLPVMDGLEALQHIRADARTRAIPVVAVTASAMPGDQIKIGAAGFDGHVRKPIDVKEFAAFVRRVLAAGPRAAESPA
jgi:two-component system cell cycle response regulator DivK